MYFAFAVQWHSDIIFNKLFTYKGPEIMSKVCWLKSWDVFFMWYSTEIQSDICFIQQRLKSAAETFHYSHLMGSNLLQCFLNLYLVKEN